VSVGNGRLTQEQGEKLVVVGIQEVDLMAEVAESKNMKVVAEKLRSIRWQMDFRKLRVAKITKTSGQQAEMLAKLNEEAREWKWEMETAEMENERNSEAYRMGRL
jgi:hypothetical protein